MNDFFRQISHRGTAVLALILFLIPTPIWAPIQGVPLNSLLERIVLLILVLACCFAAKSNIYAGKTQSSRSSNKSRFFFYSLLALILFKTLTMIGSYCLSTSPLIHVCYQASRAGQLEKDCYFSADQAFRPRDASFYLADQSFVSEQPRRQWFRNDERWYTDKTHPESFQVRIQGLLHIDKNKPIRLHARGAGEGRIGSLSVLLKKGESAEKEMPSSILGDSEFVPVSFLFLDGTSSGLLIEQQNTRGKWKPVKATSGDLFLDYYLKLAGYGFSFVSLFTAILFLFALLSQLSFGMGAILFLPALCLAGRPIIGYPFPPELALSTLIVGPFLEYKLNLKRTSNLVWVGLIIAVCSYYCFHRFGSFAGMIFRSEGDDPLSYDSLARRTLKELSLRGGESVFYYQPLFRYYHALMLGIFGEANIQIAWLNLCLVTVSFFLSLKSLVFKLRPTVFGLFNVVAFIFFSYWYIPENIFLNLSEFLGWAFLFPGTCLVLETLCEDQFNHKKVSLAGVLLVLSALVRPNFLLGAGALYGFCLINVLVKSSERSYGLGRVVKAALLPLGVLLLPLVHNLYYGGKWVLFVDRPPVINVELPLSMLLQIFSNSEALAHLMYQLKHTFYVGKLVIDYGNWMPFWAHVLLFSFCVTFIASMASSSVRRRWESLAGLVVMSGFLYLNVFYSVANYYPRFIINSFFYYAMFTLFISREGLNLSFRFPITKGQGMRQVGRSSLTEI